MQKQVKKSKLVGFEQDKLKQYIIDLDRDVFNLFQYEMNFPRVYIQLTVPTIPNDTIALWHDTTANKYYWLINIDGVQKKSELT
jgi:hypothetical protein